MTKKLLIAPVLLAATALLAGCAGGAGGADKAASGTDKSAAVATISKGTLTVGLSPDFPPLEYLDGEKLIGSDVELVKAVAKKLGLKVKFEQQKFDQLINSVRTNRVDVAISGMSDTVERQKTLDFVDYYNSTGRFYTLAANAGKFKKDSDMCGAAVAVSTKTDYYPALQEFSKKQCEEKGASAVEIVGTDSGAAARLQLEQGRAIAAVQGAENLAYFEQQEPGKYKIVLDVLQERPFAAAVRKGNTALAEALEKAFNELYKEGTTEKILTKYGIPDGLRAPAINEVKE